MKKWKSIILLFIVLNSITSAQTTLTVNGFTKFTELLIPEAICSDKSGNVIVSSVDPDNVFQDLLTKFSSNASILKRINLTETGRMKYDSVLKKIWMLIDKKFYLIDPNDFSFSLFFDISKLDIDTDQVYDISTELPFPSFLDPTNANYCDFDFLYRGEQIDLFVAGFFQAWHFILRIRLTDEIVQSSTVIVTSGATLSPHDNGPHGIAVNSQGIVLTTLGWGDVANSDRPVWFGVDFPEDQNQPPVYLWDKYQSFSSRGMCTDDNGNFYIASGWGGGGTAGGSKSCLIFVPASLDSVFTFAFNSLFANPRDVTLDTENGLIYVTDSDMDYFTNNDVIWVIPQTIVGVKNWVKEDLSYELFQNFPNLFNSSTSIKFSLPSNEKVTLQVFDILGREVSTLINEEKYAGTHEVPWNAEGIVSGVYFYILTTSHFTEAKKLVVLR